MVNSLEGQMHLGAAEMQILAQRKYFDDLAQRYLPQMRLLFRGGKLWKNAPDTFKSETGWRNVAEHCLVQIAMAEILSEVLELSDEDSMKLANTAAVHDWSKRYDRKPEEFRVEERVAVEKYLAAANPDPALMHATGVDFIASALIDKDATLLQKIMFYLDDLCRGSEIVTLEARLSELEARRQDLNAREDLIQKLGGKYWDKERELAFSVQEEIYQLLKIKGINLNTPDDIPEFLKQEIGKRIEAFK